MTPREAGGRIASLDLIRGIAVLGILAINIAGFAGPPVATLSPHEPSGGTFGDEIAYAVAFVFFEGKMRALFALLFGAGLVYFDRRAPSRGAYPDLKQFRRLCWLAVFGLLHFFLLWWGDILFTYALCGILVLFVRDAPWRPLLIGSVLVYVLWHLVPFLGLLPELAMEDRVRAGMASGPEAKQYADWLAAVSTYADEETAAISGSFLHHAHVRWSNDALDPLLSAWNALGEVFPLMIWGVLMARSGFFAGAWPDRALRKIGVWCAAAGLALTLAALSWVWPRGFPLHTMETLILFGMAVPHALMAMGYAALLVLATPRLAATGPGRNLMACGRMAFSNYIGTSLIMTALFYGWGLGLAGRYGHAALWLFVVLGWVSMLAASTLWLARFRRGPLEWAWRSLVEMRFLPQRR